MFRSTGIIYDIFAGNLNFYRRNRIANCGNSALVARTYIKSLTLFVLITSNFFKCLFKRRHLQKSKSYLLDMRTIAVNIFDLQKYEPGQSDIWDLGAFVFKNKKCTISGLFIDNTAVNRKYVYGSISWKLTKKLCVLDIFFLENYIIFEFCLKQLFDGATVLQLFMIDPFRAHLNKIWVFSENVVNGEISTI